MKKEISLIEGPKPLIIDNLETLEKYFFLKKENNKEYYRRL